MTVVLPARLSLADGTALVVSSVIGIGIFTTPAIVAGMVPDARWTIALWLAGGLLAFAGAATYAELGKICPQAGGEYVYLSRAFGPLVGFLAGWTSFVAGFSGALAAGAVALATHLGQYVPALAGGTGSDTAPLGLRSLVAAGVLILFGGVHAIGWTAGKLAQRSLALLVLAIILLFVVTGFAIGTGSWDHLRATAGTPVDARLWLLALIPVMFTYSGWNAAAYVAEEIREPERNLGRALALGTLITVVAYVSLNVLFTFAIPRAEMGQSINVGDAAAQRLFGVPGGSVTPLLILTFAGAISAMMAAGPRVYFAMARDGVLPAWIARLHPRLGTPIVAIALQTACSVLLVLVGGFQAILLYTGFAVVLSSGVAAVALFVLQRRLGIPRHPVRGALLPALFALSALAMVLAAVNQAARPSLVGLVVIAAGIPVYLALRRSRVP